MIRFEDIGGDYSTPLEAGRVFGLCVELRATILIRRNESITPIHVTAASNGVASFYPIVVPPHDELRENYAEYAADSVHK